MLFQCISTAWILSLQGAAVSMKQDRYGRDRAVRTQDFAFVILLLLQTAWFLDAELSVLLWLPCAWDNLIRLTETEPTAPLLSGALCWGCSGRVIVYSADRWD